MSDKKKNEEQEHIYDSSEALAQELSKAEHFVEQNKKLVLTIGSVIAAIILIFLGGKYYISSQNTIAQQELFQAVYYFEADSLDLALNGDGNNYGLLDIVSEYGMTDAANVASFYAGTAYLKQGDFESALEYLNKFSSSDYLVQARAYSLIGDAHMELGDFGKAASMYEKAAGYNANKEFSPIYLQKAAIANERNGDAKAALANYESIVSDFFGATEYQDAKKHAARLRGLL
ncbi:tetratricopeptide repeat protein [Reichenbachiella versicolor]|uniref:tetratricopeptide repeat protein n=1 Tax=Reichenbachiella versicolor TaxID=1821036 RepID=UPI000D6DFA81|nr:tetratricopeptide repeat protein [Reichenbachiella versicolor]